jgi:hypothetical protein
MEYLGLIIALIGSAFTIVAAMIAMMLWVRSEANSDRRDIMHLISAIHMEMKDFHVRLCIIEENNKQKEK